MNSVWPDELWKRRGPITVNFPCKDWADGDDEGEFIAPLVLPRFSKCTSVASHPKLWFVFFVVVVVTEVKVMTDTCMLKLVWCKM